MIFESEPITGTNLSESHIYITRFRKHLPQDAIGGNTSSAPATKLVRLEFDGRTTDTYIPTHEDGRPRTFFRDRSFTRQFIEHTGAGLGDVVLFEQIGPYHYKLSLKEAHVGAVAAAGPSGYAGVIRRYALPYQYADFFRNGASEKELVLLKAHALGGEMSMTELAPAIGADGLNGVNGLYGGLGARLAAEFGLTAAILEGKPVKYSVFAAWRDPGLVAPRAEDKLSSRKASWRTYLHEATIRGLHLAGVLNEDELADSLRRLSEVLQDIEQARTAITSSLARVEDAPAPLGDPLPTSLDPSLLWENSIDDMVKTAESTVAHSNGQIVERTVKNKILMMSAHELRDHVHTLIREQNGLCKLTGLRMQPLGSHQDKPLVASLDRIDSDGHYQKGNLQIVCRFVNRWKSDTPDAEFRRLLALVQAVDRG